MRRAGALGLVASLVLGSLLLWIALESRRERPDRPPGAAFDPDSPDPDSPDPDSPDPDVPDQAASSERVPTPTTPALERETASTAATEGPDAPLPHDAEVDAEVDVEKRALPGLDLFAPDVLRSFRFRTRAASDRRALDRGTREDVPVTLEVEGHVFEEVGLRMKGASSAMVPSRKRPFNLSMDAFHRGRDLFGFKTLNLNNGAFDPTLTREALAYHIFRHYIPAPRTTYVRVYIDDEYRGVYLLVEQINRRMLRDWFVDASGARFKGDRPGFAQLETSTLTWQGDEPEDYIDSYVLKTESKPEAWSQLLRVIRVLETEPDETFPGVIESLVDVDRVLWYVALNNLVVNTDDYTGGGHNFYLYFDPSDGRMHILPWDLNEAFGVHAPRNAPERYPPLARASARNRPLVRRILAVPRWRSLYLAHYREALAKWLDWDGVLEPLHARFQSLIADAVEEDELYLFPKSRFSADAPGRVRFLVHSVPPLAELVRERRAHLLRSPELAGAAPRIELGGLPAPDRPVRAFRVTARVASELPIAEFIVRLASIDEAGQRSRFRTQPLHDDGLHDDGDRDDGLWASDLIEPAGRLGLYVLARDTDGTVTVAPGTAEHRVVEVRGP